MSFTDYLESIGFQADACESLTDPDFYALAERLYKALEFYAIRDNYDRFGIPHSDPDDCRRVKRHHPDMGNIAREALGRETK
ncbi:MAG: hypothetical protein H6Q00_1400 [Holophagaceae bacterium]|nr:hypothetical protein [Holophagaceae bacterium]